MTLVIGIENSGSLITASAKARSQIGPKIMHAHPIIKVVIDYCLSIDSKSYWKLTAVLLVSSVLLYLLKHWLNLDVFVKTLYKDIGFLLFGCACVLGAFLAKQRFLKFISSWK